MCKKLSASKRLVIIIDSLDVLSLTNDGKNIFDLIDILNNEPNITIISSCRPFDLQYDEQLRSQKWEHKIELGGFDVETVINPCLKKWGVSHNNISDDLKEILRLPLNLRLFKDVALCSNSYAIHNAYAFYNIYIEEIINKKIDEQLRNKAINHKTINILTGLAYKLLKRRSSSIQKRKESIDEETLRILVSNNILYENPSTREVGFSHQILFDMIIVYSESKNETDLADFIQSSNDHPFYRSAVRAYLFYLRSCESSGFIKQVKTALFIDTVAYHFKRLIAESLAEINPDTEKDYEFVATIFEYDRSLFERMFSRAKSEGWFNCWLLILKKHPNDIEWRQSILKNINKWMDAYSSETINIWKQALENNWENAVSYISNDLNKFLDIKNKGIYDLVDFILNDKYPDSFANALARYVDFGYETNILLWKHISKNVPDRKFNCNFSEEDFLVNHLAKSDDFINLVMDDLEKWERAENISGKSLFFSENKHNITLPYQEYRFENHGVRCLLFSLEKSLEKRLKENDQWIDNYKDYLMNSNLEIHIYILINVYIEDLEFYKADIKNLLTNNHHIFYFTYIDSSIKKLLRKTYYLLDVESQDRIQKSILSTSNENNKDHIQQFRIYEYLLSIPEEHYSSHSKGFIKDFRSNENLIASYNDLYRNEQDHETSSRKLKEYRKTLIESMSININADSNKNTGTTEDWSDDIKDLSAFFNLSTKQIIKLLNICSDIDPEDDDLIDEVDKIRSISSMASSIEPVYYLNILSYLDGNEFAFSIIDGISNHLQYAPKGWEFRKSYIGEISTAKYLLSILKTHWKLDINLTHAKILARGVQTCSRLLYDNDSSKELSVLIHCLFKHEDPKPNECNYRNIDDNYIHDVTTKSIRGITVASIIYLYKNHFDHEGEIPDHLLNLLSYAANDKSEAIRAIILKELSYFPDKYEDFGKKIFGDIFREQESDLWNVAEDYLYAYICKDFEYVDFYLKRMLSDSNDYRIDAWTRLLTLSYIRNKTTQDDYINKLTEADLLEVWCIATQTLLDNLGQQEVENKRCIIGLSKIILLMPRLNDQVVSLILDPFNHNHVFKYFDSDFVKLFIDKIDFDDGALDLSNLFDYISSLAKENHRDSLILMENIAQKILGATDPFEIRSKPLISAFSSIMKACEDSDEEDLKQAILLQDKFLQMKNIYDMKASFEESD
jgi:hypothetical protein